ncbi:MULTISPECIES: DUF5818 domain-containing protein [unclassified Sphingobium]|uniref:DUF5818 domain-containing protein n=1 Tax=unclassified Sphingobium TaxID=2611147 RepID=UPI000D15C018|nr:MULTISPECIES: DUF5818 domain-containing protein [unclassified Sphingobium]PSO12610.1 hypothetical protein C7E20_05735 [Sphingobium sp. AEW4]TWD09788.1 hypothetical protein FB595_104135 [Sphingobium sp. AEW010]TWD26459.1 hypothetical protein FB596_104135 [Sphingobium sp. AEW013]TWD27772.1 hypothetical protein FB594_105193 [Sphingobium sp. AEW001]
MPRGEPLDLIGVLLGEGPYPTLRMADGGEWRLDISGRYRHLLGQRVRIAGRRSEFDMIDVDRIEAAPA